jgi:hypothetical protein
VEATLLNSDSYRIEGHVPEDEEWAFAPGTIVRCALHAFSGGSRMTAIGPAD